VLVGLRWLVLPVGLALLLALRGPPAAQPGPLPLGDGKLSSGPRVGYLWACGRPPGGGGAQRDGSWIRGATWDPAAKIVVGGEVSWPSRLAIEPTAATRRLTGNGLPSHATGVFPIRPDEPAYRFDRNPNPVQPQQLDMSLPAAPARAAQPSCLPMGQIGLMLTGAALFNAIDLQGRDASAHEVQDRCGGHPELRGQYHYHSVSPCADDPGTGHSALVGYALDGFGLYGNRGIDGKRLRNDDLDECHGHTHAIEGTEAYHYHATDEYPYTLGCFRGVR
jgi:hypothetical protein